MAEADGATAGERFIEACRGNNTDLLEELLADCPSSSAATSLLNDTKTVLGNYGYHEAALRGNYDIIDMLLDQEGFECDPIASRDGNTPLHSLVEWINKEGESEETNKFAQSLLAMMMEAGSDPNIKNHAGNTPLTHLSARKTDLRTYFAGLVKEYNDTLASEREQARAKEHEERQRIRDAKMLEKLSLEEAAREAKVDDDDDGGEASASGSDSDFDIVAFRRERERLKMEAQNGGHRMEGKGSQGDGVGDPRQRSRDHPPAGMM